MNLNLIKEVIANLTEEEVTIIENGISWTEFGEFNNKITFEDDKVVYDLEDGKVLIKVSKEIFLSNEEKSVEALYNWGFDLTEGDRENSLYDDEDNEDFVRENEVIEISDKDFFMNS